MLFIHFRMPLGYAVAQKWSEEHSTGNSSHQHLDLEQRWDHFDAKWVLKPFEGAFQKSAIHIC